MTIGIDIGTSYSTVAYLKDGKADAIAPAHGGNAAVPSCAFADSGGKLLIGETARKSRTSNPSRCKENFKRDFGTDKPYILGDMEITPDEIYTEYFHYFKECAERFAEDTVELAYITHPVDYSAEKKLRLERAANMAGLLKVKLIDEPTAAALSYFAAKLPVAGEKLLVVDVGGGTTDLTLVEITSGGGFRLLAAPVGDNRLGGADFDRAVFDDILGFLAMTNDIAPAKANAKWVSDMADTARTVKEILSAKDSHEEQIMFGFGTIPYTLTRKGFNALISEPADRACALIERIAKNAGLTPPQIDKVLLVGGSTLIPFIKMRVEETIGKVALRPARPELAVALGAVLKHVAGEVEDEHADADSGEKRNDDEWVRSEKQDNPFVVHDFDTYSDKIFSSGLYRFEHGDYDKAFRLITESANSYNDKARVWLGVSYAEGRGVAKDLEKAVSWFEQAAESGNGEALKKLVDTKAALAKELWTDGDRLSDGERYAEAVEKFAKSAALGSVDALNSLGWLYYGGEGVGQDYAKAFGYFSEAEKVGKPGE